VSVNVKDYLIDKFTTFFYFCALISGLSIFMKAESPAGCNTRYYNSIMGYEKIENFDIKITEKLAAHYKAILKLLGEDEGREGLLKTPERVAKSMLFLTQGYEIDPVEILNSAKFKEDYRQIVLVKEIEIYSMCEHHMLPFYGKAHVAYIPNGYITGLSKIPRVVDAFARRLQVQERLTVQIRDCIQNTLNPLGVAVVIEAAHMCMQIRGVQKQNSVTTTSAFTGAFLKDIKTREEFMRLIGVSLH
jgi:GTP cyclohydrolase IA